MIITPLRKNILFSFIEKTNSKGQFERTTKSGLYLSAEFDDSAKSPRWAKITHVGPDSEYCVGLRILIQALMWTEYLMVEGKKVWKTDDTKVMAVDMDGILVPTKNHVVMTRENKNTDQTSSGLFVVQHPPETGIGIVAAIGDKVKNIDILNKIIQFKDVNFFNKFTFYDTEFWYISEDDIYCYQETH